MLLSRDKLFSLICLLLLLLVAFPVWAQDYNKGEEARERGDYETALQNFHPLAEQGDAKAQNSLGVMYSHGQGVPQDYEKALKWYRKAVEQGDAGAQYSLGNRYRKGQGVSQDYEKALKWYRKSVKQGHAKAQYNLGVMYIKGLGVVKGNIQAYKWFYIAAAHGHKEAEKWRDKLARNINSDQIAEAKQHAREWMEKHGDVVE